MSMLTSCILKKCMFTFKKRLIFDISTSLYVQKSWGALFNSILAQSGTFNRLNEANYNFLLRILSH